MGKRRKSRSDVKATGSGETGSIPPPPPSTWDFEDMSGALEKSPSPPVRGEAGSIPPLPPPSSSSAPVRGEAGSPLPAPYLWDPLGISALPARVHTSSEASIRDTMTPTPIEFMLASWEDAEEVDLEDTEYPEEDRENLYYAGLVDTFLTAAYTPGMIWSLAEPGQEEDAMTPSASSSWMEAQAARQVSELQSAETDVTTESGVEQSPETRMVPRERWTWKDQCTLDGDDCLTVMSPTKKQPHGGACMPTATGHVMESNLRVQHHLDCLLSLDNLVQIRRDCIKQYPNKAMSVDLFFSMVQAQGVLSEHDYRNMQTARDAVRYHIKRYNPYRVDDRKNMRHALFKLRSTGPLMGVIRISKNYEKCAKSGEVYKYDANLTDKDKEGKIISKTHAVCIYSFAIEDVPYLECANTHGDRYSDCLKIDVTSLCQLYSVVVGIADK